MKTVFIIPGYGDNTGYIKRLTRHWPKKYGLKPYIYAFGSKDRPEQYQRNWQRFIETLKEVEPEVVIGISFGFSIACRSIIDYPKIVKKIVSIAGPSDLAKLNPETIRNSYPMLGKSLSAFNPKDLPVERILTLRPLIDTVVYPKNVVVSGAINKRIPMISHAGGIGAAFIFRAGTIARFINREIE